MAGVDPTLTDMQRAVTNAFGAHWKLFLFQGVVMAVLGLLAICAPVAASIAVAIYVGWLLLISGIIGLIAIVSTHHVHAFLWSLVTAALSVVIGVLLVLMPVQGAISLTIVLTAFFIAEGVFQTTVAIASRQVLAGTWVWMLLSGLADLVLAAIIIEGWPGTAIWALGLLVGVNLLTSGWAVVVAAFAGRRMAEAAGHAPA
jgi:uncharacterized membrane protein HdeD (DUF308 family)